MKFVIFQGVNGKVATLEGLLEVEADVHFCLGNLITFSLRDYGSIEGSLKCLKLAKKQLEVVASTKKDSTDTEKALRLLRGYNEEVYLNLHKKSKGHPTYHKLGDENLAFIRSFYLRLQRNDGRAVFLPWFGRNSAVPVNDTAGLVRKPRNENRLRLLTEKDIAQHYGKDMQKVMQDLFPFWAETFIHFVGKWRLATLWEMRGSIAVPSVIPPDKYEEKGSIRTVSYVLEAHRPTIVFPGNAENGYYCTYDTGSKELTIVHDKTLIY